MEFNNIGFTILILIIIFIYLLYQYHYYSNIETIVSKVDNRNYDVQIKSDAQDAADLIAKVREKLILLVDHMYKTFPNDTNLTRISLDFRCVSDLSGGHDPNFRLGTRRGAKAKWQNKFDVGGFYNELYI
jgi:hypothetical protein